MFAQLEGEGITLEYIQSRELHWNAPDFFVATFLPAWANAEFYQLSGDLPQDGIYFSSLTPDELEIIMFDLLLPLAPTQKELEAKKALARKKIEAVQPPVELTDHKFDHLAWLRTAEDVIKAKENGILVDVGPTVIRGTEGKFSISELVEFVRGFAAELEVSGLGVIDVQGKDERYFTTKLTSAERPAVLQALLVKLGYPAAIRSYHNLGRALDISIVDPYYKEIAMPELGYYEFDEKEGMFVYKGEGDILFKLNELYVAKGQSLNMRDLIDAQLLPQDHIIVKIFLLLEEMAQRSGVTLFDETAFFSIIPEDDKFDDKGNKVKVTHLNPVWHLQIDLPVDQPESVEA